MNENNKICVIAYEVLPLAIKQVLEVKTLLATEETSVLKACKKIGISKSTYYKYKDKVNFLQKTLDNKT